MSLIAQAASVAGGDGVFLDVAEVQNAAATFATVTRRGYDTPLSTSAGILSVTAGTAPVIARRNGLLVREWTSVFSVLGSISSAASPWPIGQSWAGRPPALRFPTRWVFEGCLVRVTNPPLSALVLNFGIQLNNNASGQPTWGVTGSPYFLLSSKLERNDGNWGVISCAGGAVANAVDTGISPATPIAVRIVYEDAETPRMWAEVNGTVYGMLTGMANVPNFADAAPAAARAQFFATQGQTGAPAGQVDRLWNIRVWAQDMGNSY